MVLRRCSDLELDTVQPDGHSDFYQEEELHRGTIPLMLGAVANCKVACGSDTKVSAVTVGVACPVSV